MWVWAKHTHANPQKTFSCHLSDGLCKWERRPHARLSLHGPLSRPSCQQTEYFFSQVGIKAYIFSFETPHRACSLLLLVIREAVLSQPSYIWVFFNTSCLFWFTCVAEMHSFPSHVCSLWERMGCIDLLTDLQQGMIVHMNPLSIIMASLVWNKHLDQYFIQSITLLPSIWSHLFCSINHYLLCFCL